MACSALVQSAPKCHCVLKRLLLWLFKKSSFVGPLIYQERACVQKNAASKPSMVPGIKPPPNGDKTAPGGFMPTF